jgi:hypothetical protein
MSGERKCGASLTGVELEIGGKALFRVGREFT